MKRSADITPADRSIGGTRLLHRRLGPEEHHGIQVARFSDPGQGSLNELGCACIAGPNQAGEPLELSGRR
jgi:hypothetical protein